MKILAKQSEKRAYVANGTEIMRMKFAKARKFLNPLNYIIQMGFAPQRLRKGKTAIGRAMSAILQSAMVGEYPHIEVDPARVKISAGVTAILPVCGVERIGATIRLRWITLGAPLRGAERDDRIILCAYAVQEELAAINEEEVLRAEGDLQMQLPEDMEHMPVNLYLCVHDRDKINFSNSQYLGVFA